MKTTDIILLAIWAIMSIIASAVTIHDKLAAKRGSQRVPEATLFTLAFFLGGLGMLITMLLIRHKTRHKQFMLGIPLIIIVHTVLAVFYYAKLRPLLP